MTAKTDAYGIFLESDLGNTITVDGNSLKVSSTYTGADTANSVGLRHLGGRQ